MDNTAVTAVLYGCAKHNLAGLMETAGFIETARLKKKMDNMAEFRNNTTVVYMVQFFQNIFSVPV